MPNALAVALHDVTPQTFGRCALIRDWLDDLGVDKVTLLVVPAGDLHPFSDRRPELAEWLCGRVARGDAVAQHGLQDRRGEFARMGDDDACRALDAGRRVLRLAGVQPRGFVAPGYAYPDGLRRALATRFHWWSGALHVQTRGGAQRTRAPVLRLRHGSALRRALAPASLRCAAGLAGPLLRLDLHPRDFDVRANVGAVEHVLRGARGRVAVTYDEL